MNGLYVHKDIDTTINDDTKVDNNSNQEDKIDFDLSGRNIYDILETACYPDYNVSEYINSPIVGRKSIMNRLGDFITKAEHTLIEYIDPNAWYTLRADGKHFSRLMKDGKKSGLFEAGYSLVFENAMIMAVQDVLETHFYGVCAFTQSDEVTMVFRNAQVRGDGQISNWDSKGSLIKYLTHQSSAIASRFLHHIVRQFNEEIEKELGNIVENLINNSMNENLERLRKLQSDLLKINKIPVIKFDCRFAQWNSLSSAFQVVIWRAWDCASNGVSSGIHLEPGLFNKKSKAEQNTTEKLKIMIKDKILTKLTDHQKYGTFIYKKAVEEEKHIEYTGKDILVVKYNSEKLSYPLMRLIKDGRVSYDETYNTLKIGDLIVSELFDPLYYVDREKRIADGNYQQIKEEKDQFTVTKSGKIIDKVANSNKGIPNHKKIEDEDKTKPPKRATGAEKKAAKLKTKIESKIKKESSLVEDINLEKLLDINTGKIKQRVKTFQKGKPFEMIAMCNVDPVLPDMIPGFQSHED